MIRRLFKDAIRVPSLKLETLLAKYNIGAIDLLDIDVEGTELEVWKSFDYTKHKPKVVIIESYTLGLSDNSAKIKDFFSNLPYLEYLELVLLKLFDYPCVLRPEED